MKKYIKAIALVLSVILLMQTTPVGLFQAADKIPAGQFTAQKSAAEGVPITGSEGESFLTAEQAAAAGTSEATKKVSATREPSPITGEVVELRSENTKYFRHRDGTYVAAMYAEPVHYKDATGKYKDIDNSLQLNSKKLSVTKKATYTPAASGLDIRIPQDFANGQQLTIGKEGYTVGMGVKAQSGATVDLSTVKAAVKNGLGDDAKDDSDAIKDNKIEADNSKKMELKKQTSSVTYKDVFPGADLEYVVTSGRIKESIFIKEAQKEYAYQFNLSLDGLIPVPQEDGSIFLLKDAKDKEPIFKLEAPYMYDAAGEESTALKMLLAKDGVLTLTADEKWINDEARKLPVVIDPTLEMAAFGFQDAYISTLTKNSNYSTNSENYIGRSNLGIIKRTFLRFQLPTLPHNSVVTGANLIVRQTNNGYDPNGNNQLLYAFDCTGKASWSASSVTWNNQPLSTNTNGPQSNGTRKIDYATISNSNISYVLNLTRVVKGWYENKNNNGLMFATSNESTSGHILIGSIRNGTTSNRPAVTIYYNVNTGIEDYWAYETTNMGRSGTANVNVYNGSLTYTHGDLAMTGNRLPIKISHVYNSNNLGTYGIYDTYYSGMNVGQNYHLNLQELLLPIAQTDPLYLGIEQYRYKFYDGDGTLHYFKLNTVNGVQIITHEFDTNLVVSAIDNSITDGQGNKKYYNSAGKLFKIKDNNDNTQIFTFDPSGNRITEVTDGTDIPGTDENEARVAKLNYNAYNQLVNIVDPAGRITSFAYDYVGSTGHLSSITYPDGKTTTYQNNNLYPWLISRITAYDNSYIEINYIQVSCCGARVSDVYQHDKAGAEADFLKFKYAEANNSDQVAGNTVVTNKINKTKSYLFDGYGRATGITNQDGQSQYALYNAKTNTVVNSNKFNKNVDNSELQTIANNLVKNHGFEQTGYWSALQTTTDGNYGYDTAENSGGYRSMKMELTGNAGVFEVDQDFTAAAGQNYTVSVDIKIPHDLTLTGNNGVKFGFVYYVNGAWHTDGSEWIAATTGNEFLDPDLDRGWQRFTHTMTLPSGTLSNCHVFIELARAEGVAYFDNIQVEKSGGARYYNLVENSDFSNAPGATTSPTGTAAYGWTMTGTQSGDGVQVGADGRNYVLVSGSPKIEKKISQSVPVNADAGDVLVIGGKAAAYARMGCEFSITADIYSTATEKEEPTIQVDFDPSISMIHQTTATYYTLTTPCHHIVYSFVYDDQVNGVSFANAFIYVGNYGEHYEYDGDGQISEVVNDDNEKSTDYTYVNNDLTAVDQTISGTTSNVASLDYEDHNVTTITNNNGIVTFDYNDVNNNFQNGQVTSQTITGEGLTKTERMTYIQGGNYLKTFTDANGGVTTYTYDNNDQALKGLVMKVVDPKGNETNFTYNPNTDELLTTSGNATTTPPTPSVTSFTSQDYLPKTITRNSTTYSYDYDNQNRVTAAKVGSQALVTNTYDSRQRLSEQSYANQAVYTPVYDSRDRLAGDKWNNVQTATYFYNENDRLSQFADNTTGTTYKYDYAFYGLVNNIYGSDGSKTAYDYNAAGQISHLMFSKNNDTIYKARYQTNEKGNMEDVVLTTLGNGTLLHYNYDGFSRLTGNSCGPLITERTYLEGASYAPNLKYTTNLVETYKNKIDAAVMQQYEYVYDDNSNITGITETEANETTTYTYDGLNRLTGESGPNLDYVYNYDVGGNLTTITNSDESVTYKSYAYGNSNWKDQLTSITTNGNTYGITYDANGNPLTYDGYTFTWQRGRQLTAFTGNGQNISYTYDAQGHRIQQTVNGITLTYTYSGDLLMRQSDGTNTLDFQYDANGIAAGFNYNGTPYFYMRNLQGDVVAIADANGTLVAEYAYDAWGNVTAYSGAMASINPIRYRGYYQDPVTGWYFLQSRYYNPDWRRFLNADALFVAGDAINGSNMYAYCNGNPVMYQDPSGMGAFGDFVGNAIRVRSKVTSWLLLPVTYLVVAPASNVLLYATRNIVGEDPVEKVAPYLKMGAENILPKVPPILKPGPSTIPTGLRHFMPINMAFGAPWAGYFLGFETSTYRKGLLKFKNYTTVETVAGEPEPMWQSQVGYDELYDLVFSLGGPIERIKYKFEEGTGSNKKYYVIWLWKGDYWNLGAGTEIGIYYTGNEDDAINNFYIIDTSLTLHVHMLIKYRTFFGQIPMTLNDFHQTNWWVCSFTPSIQFPNVDWIDVDMDVRFTGNNYHKLMKPFYNKWKTQGTDEDWEKVSMLPTAYKTRSTGHAAHKCSCDHPALCTCSWNCCSNPCRYYTEKCDTTCSHYNENENGFQFNITY